MIRTFITILLFQFRFARVFTVCMVNLGFIKSSLASYIERLRPLISQRVPFSCASLVHRGRSMTSSVSCPSPHQGARQASRRVLVTMCHTEWTMVTLSLTQSSAWTCRSSFDHHYFDVAHVHDHSPLPVSLSIQGSFHGMCQRGNRIRLRSLYV